MFGFGKTKQDILETNATGVQINTSIRNMLEPLLAPDQVHYTDMQLLRTAAVARLNYMQQELAIRSSLAKARIQEQRGKLGRNMLTNEYGKEYAKTVVKPLANQPSAATRQTNPVLTFLWTSVSHWRCSDATGQIVDFEITKMTDEHLWTTINWLVSNTVYLAACAKTAQTGKSTPISNLEAATWLAAQPVVIAMVFEALKRQLTFSDATALFIRIHIKTDRQVNTAPPWKQPFSKNALPDLKDKLEKTVHAEKIRQKLGTRNRAIALEDTSGSGEHETRP